MLNENDNDSRMDERETGGSHIIWDKVIVFSWDVRQRIREFVCSRVGHLWYMRPPAGFWSGYRRCSRCGRMEYPWPKEADHCIVPIHDFVKGG